MISGGDFVRRLSTTTARAAIVAENTPEVGEFAYVLLDPLGDADAGVSAPPAADADNMRSKKLPSAVIRTPSSCLFPPGPRQGDGMLTFYTLHGVDLRHCEISTSTPGFCPSGAATGV